MSHSAARIILDRTLRQLNAAALDEIAALAREGTQHALEHCHAERGKLAPRDIAADIQLLQELAERCQLATDRKFDIGGHNHDRNFAAQR